MIQLPSNSSDERKRVPSLAAAIASLPTAGKAGSRAFTDKSLAAR